MSLRKKLTILTLIISILIGPVEFIASFLISVYTEGLPPLPSNYTWFSLFFDPWFLGFLTSSFVFGCAAVWAIYGIVWALYKATSLRKTWRANTKTKNLNILTIITSLLLGPVLFVVDMCAYGVQSESWFIVGVGDFVSLSVYGFVFTWFIYGLARWIIMPPCLWIAKVCGSYKK